MSEIDYTPRTRPTPAAEIRVGDVVVERPEHPARVTRLAYIQSKVGVYARYVWQSSGDPEWLLGRYAPATLLEKAVR